MTTRVSTQRAKEYCFLSEWFDSFQQRSVSVTPKFVSCGSWSTDEDVAALDELALRVTHVGTSHAFATARFSMVPGGEGGQLHPSPNGQTYFRVPRAGRLMELDRLVDHGHGTVRRPPPQCEALVAYAESRITASGAAEAFHDWVTLSFKGASWGADTSHTLARAFRRAVLSIAGDNAPALIHGHDPASPILHGCLYQTLTMRMPEAGFEASRWHCPLPLQSKTARWLWQHLRASRP